MHFAQNHQSHGVGTGASDFSGYDTYLLEKIKENLISYKWAVKIFLVWSVIWTIIFIATVYIDYNDCHPIKGIDIYAFNIIVAIFFGVSFFLGFMGWVMFIIFCVATNTEIKDFRLAQENIDEYKKVIKQRETEK